MTKTRMLMTQVRRRMKLTGESFQIR